MGKCELTTNLISDLAPPPSLACHPPRMAAIHPVSWFSPKILLHPSLTWAVCVAFLEYCLPRKALKVTSATWSTFSYFTSFSFSMSQTLSRVNFFIVYRLYLTECIPSKIKTSSLLSSDGILCSLIRFDWLFFLWYQDLNSGPSPWATPPALFLWRVFWDRISQLFASWIAGITGVTTCAWPDWLFVEWIISNRKKWHCFLNSYSPINFPTK
jgi:hypothetical protein